MGLCSYVQSTSLPCGLKTRALRHELLPGYKLLSIFFSSSAGLSNFPSQKTVNY